MPFRRTTVEGWSNNSRTS